MSVEQQISADMELVLNHVLRDEDRRYGVQSSADPEHAHARLAVRVAHMGLANLQELGTVLGWVLTTMKWAARHRPLSNEEMLVYAAALRVSEFAAMFDTLAVLGEAIAAGDWAQARAQWLRLAPCHALLIAAFPDAAYLNIILQDLTQKTSIH